MSFGLLAQNNINIHLHTDNEGAPHRASCHWSIWHGPSTFFALSGQYFPKCRGDQPGPTSRLGAYVLSVLLRALGTERLQ